MQLGITCILLTSSIMSEVIPMRPMPSSIAANKVTDTPLPTESVPTESVEDARQAFGTSDQQHCIMSHKSCN